MSFTLRLGQDLTAVEAGATVPLSIEIAQKGEESDRYEIQVEGIDPEWTAVPEAVFNVAAGETVSQKVFFKLPRSSESLAGNYPFVVRVRSLNSGESKTAQGVLQIKPFHHLSMEVSPKKGYTSPLRPQTTLSVIVMNLGNTEHTLQLSGADPEEGCTYDFASEQVTVGPGQQKEVDVTIRTGTPSWIAPMRLFGFAISGRSIQNPNLMASTQGQIERKPLISPGSMFLAVLILGLLALWIAVRPQPPTIAVSVDSTTLLQGQSAHFHWKADHANSVRLEIRRNVNGKVENPTIQSDLPPEGTREILATNEDTITVVAYAVAENKTRESAPVTISVQAPPPSVPPKISSFRASSRKIRLGDPVTFTFEYSSDVTKLVLSPLNETILPPANKIQITPTNVGTDEYKLYAYNAKGVAQASKGISIEVYQASEANIIEFSAHPNSIQLPDTQTTVTWTVTNAVKVELDDGSGRGLQTVEPSGSQTVLTDHDMTMKLIATDDKNVTTSQTIQIKVKPIPTPPTTSGDTGGPPTTTGGRQ